MRQDRRASLLRAGIDIATMPIDYTGTMTDELVTMSGTAYRLLTLLSSGTLSIDAEITADVCVCSGGQSGQVGSGEGGNGGAGGFLLNYYGVKAAKTQAATIGAGGAEVSSTKTNVHNNGSATTFGALSSGNAFSSAGYGGTGGGRGGAFSSSVVLPTGDGLSKHPFEDAAYFPDPHCGGGGGGGYFYVSVPRYGSTSYWRNDGGEGGTNGGDGSKGAPYSTSGTTYGGEGGVKGGGHGEYGGGSSGAGRAATYYGSGGGGAGWDRREDSKNDDNSWNDPNGNGRAGYQGVIYVRIPLKQ